jgi:hypothetical protein
MGTMDPRALEQLDVVNIDALAMRIVRSAEGAVSIIEESGRRSLAKTLLKRHALGTVFAGNESLLVEEFAFLTGRGTTDPETYYELRRRDGIPLAPGPTESASGRRTRSIGVSSIGRNALTTRCYASARSS